MNRIMEQRTEKLKYTAGIHLIFAPTDAVDNEKMFVKYEDGRELISPFFSVPPCRHENN